MRLNGLGRGGRRAKYMCMRREKMRARYSLHAARGCGGSGPGSLATVHEAASARRALAASRRGHPPELRGSRPTARPLATASRTQSLPLTAARLPRALPAAGPVRPRDSSHRTAGHHSARNLRAELQPRPAAHDWSMSSTFVPPALRIFSSRAACSTQRSQRARRKVQTAHKRLAAVPGVRARAKRRGGAEVG